jgi:hypothetical protein
MISLNHTADTLIMVVGLWLAVWYLGRCIKNANK